MVYRDRQDLSPAAVDAIPLSNNRDRYLDNCFLLCLNRDDDTETPEIHRLENNLMRELCHRTPVDRSKSQQQSKPSRQDQRGQLSENEEFDDEDLISPKQQNNYRRKGNRHDRESQMIANRSRYQRDAGLGSYSTRDQYSRPNRFYPRDDYNVMQHSDDELSVYEVYVPTNTLNRLSDKRIENNMVLIDYEDVSKPRDMRGTSVPYGYSQQNSPSQYNNYAPSNPYREYEPQYSQPPFYPNSPSHQQQPGGYYGNERDRQPYSPQSGPFLPSNIPLDHSDAINVRRHIYSPSQLPQGLTEGQLVMLLQKGNQYQQPRSEPVERPAQLFPPQKEAQPSTTSAITVSHQPSAVASARIEPFQTSDYFPPVQNKVPQMPPQIIDHRSFDEDKTSLADGATQSKSISNTVKPSKDVESKDSNEKKKDKTSDSKKDKKAEKEAGGSSKKESKKEKSSGKDSKKKKK